MFKTIVCSSWIRALPVVGLALLQPIVAQGGSQDRARKIFERLTGVPPTAAQVSSMVSEIESGDVHGAVDVAIADSNFYRIGLKRMVTPWSNVDGDADAPLNDFSATIIGMVRDDKDFRRVLFGNEYYLRPDDTIITGGALTNPAALNGLATQTLNFRVNNGNCAGVHPPSVEGQQVGAAFCSVQFTGTNPLTLQAAVSQLNAIVPGIASVFGGNRLQLADSRGIEILAGSAVATLGLSVSPQAWYAGDNSHYQDVERRVVDWGSPQSLRAASQLDYVLNDSKVIRQRSNGTVGGPLIVPAAAPMPAGVMSTRGAAAAFYFMGTNRRMVKYTFQNFMCKRLEEMKDFTLSDHRVRRDVSRSPGGNSTEYATYCKGCHVFMDGLANAFANFDYGGDDRLRFLPVVNSPNNKNNRNSSNFPQGFTVLNDNWDNNLVNASGIGWRASNSINTQSGSGAETLGQVLANSEQFSRCQVSQVFKHVCKRDPQAAEQAQVQEIVSAFESEGYNLKSIFRRVAALCIE